MAPSPIPSRRLHARLLLAADYVAGLLGGAALLNAC
jgi:hypothetical protein